jgi:hypothetical protein
VSAATALALALGLPTSASNDQIAHKLAETMRAARRGEDVRQVTKALAVLTDQMQPRRIDSTDLLAAMATALGPARPLPHVSPAIRAIDDPQEAFLGLAKLRAKAEGISLIEAARRQSKSTPELWDDVRNAAPRN